MDTLLPNMNRANIARMSDRGKKRERRKERKRKKRAEHASPGMDGGSRRTAVLEFSREEENLEKSCPRVNPESRDNPR